MEGQKKVQRRLGHKSDIEAEDDVAEEEYKAEENKVELDAPTEDRNLGVQPLP